MKDNNNYINSESTGIFMKNSSILESYEKSDNSVSNAFNSTFPDSKKNDFEFNYLDLGNKYEPNRIFNVNIENFKDYTFGYVDDYTHNWNDLVIPGGSPMEELNFINSSIFFADNY
jgi:hypothetical protein